MRRMGRIGAFLATGTIVAVTFMGCRDANEPDLDPTMGESDRARTSEEASPTWDDLLEEDQQVASGDLRNVNLEDKTFSVMTADGEIDFSFSDEMEVIGGAGTQGLTGKEGTRVTVYYRDELTGNEATKIELMR